MGGLPCKASPVSARDGRVRLHGREYTSTSLNTFAHAYRDSHKEWPEVVVREIPSAEFSLLWEEKSGEVSCLDATVKTQKKYRDDFGWLNRLRNMKRRASAREHEHKNRHASRQSKERNAHTVSLAKQRQIDQMEQQSMAGAIPPTPLEARRQQRERTEQIRVREAMERLGGTIVDEGHIDDGVFPLLETDYAFDDDQDLLAGN